MSANPSSAVPEARFEPITEAWLPAVVRIEQHSYTHPWTLRNFQELISYVLLCLVEDYFTLSDIRTLDSFAACIIIRQNICIVACNLLYVLEQWYTLVGFPVSIGQNLSHD